MNKLERNPKIVIKSYEKIGSNKVKIIGLNADDIKPVEYELSFCNIRFALDKIVDAIKWKRVVYLVQMIRW